MIDPTERQDRLTIATTSSSQADLSVVGPIVAAPTVLSAAPTTEGTKGDDDRSDETGRRDAPERDSSSREPSDSELQPRSPVGELDPQLQSRPPAEDASVVERPTPSPDQSQAEASASSSLNTQVVVVSGAEDPTPTQHSGGVGADISMDAAARSVAADPSNDRGAAEDTGMAILRDRLDAARDQADGMMGWTDRARDGQDSAPTRREGGDEGEWREQADNLLAQARSRFDPNEGDDDARDLTMGAGISPGLGAGIVGMRDALNNRGDEATRPDWLSDLFDGGRLEPMSNPFSEDDDDVDGDLPFSIDAGVVQAFDAGWSGGIEDLFG